MAPQERRRLGQRDAAELAVRLPATHRPGRVARRQSFGSEIKPVAHNGDSP
ncbi:hypothetical protein UCMB321_0565 [Pseudomonas batumici]|uniref:Uncharacterized protein n=1 Tax=Pseudomonas batumici TaxID=226910 RepID=A0A0C2I927_9PSED|nr:hypothetical protein UCMB321_0565 [Pseudomonas batumici]